MIIDNFPAMGTSVEVRGSKRSTARRARRLFAAVERRCSRFVASSELSRINADPAPEVALSPLMAALLSEADRLRRKTGGLIDPSVGGAVRAWGYDRTFFEVADLTKSPAGPSAPVDWDVSGGVLRRPPGTMFDLGGIAKGWTVDVVAERTGASVVNAGGDLRSSDPDMQVDIVDPWGEVAVRVGLGAGALATSSTTRRSWVVGGRRVHHLIDPRTMAPAGSPILMASVVAERAVDAEAGAKAVILLGEEGLAWADRCPWLRGVVAVWRTGAVYATGVECAA